MKTKILLTTVSSFFILHSAFGQGALTPPGAPAPTMKTLAQIEPRTDVLKLAGDGFNLILISQPGSYYLTTNILGVTDKNGIGIASGNVTLDLNGFAVLGAPGSLAGVYVNDSYTNITVRNGNISGWGDNGVDAYNGGYPRNLVFERLSVSRNGGSGIITEASSVVRDCLSQSNRYDGINCYGGLISGCVSRDNRYYGIEAYTSVVRDCQVQSSGIYGIYANSSSVVRDCQVQSSGSDGIDAESSVVRDCQIQSSADNGIIALYSVVRDCNVLSSGTIGIATGWGTVSGCFVQGSVSSGISLDGDGGQISGNTCNGNNPGGGIYGAGITIGGSDNRVEDNHVTASGHAGIEVIVSYVKNVVIKNTVSGNGGSNYLNTIGNDFGPIGTAATATSPWANISH